MNLIFIKIVYALFIIINLSVGLVVLLKAKHRGIKWSFFTLMGILSAWLAINYTAYFTGDKELTLIGGRTSFVVGAMIVPAFLVFAKYFPYKTKFKLIDKFVIIVPPLIIALASFGNYFLIDQIIESDGYATPIYGAQHYIFSLYIVVYLVVAFRELVIKFRKSLPLEKNKLKYIIFGFAAASFIGVLADLVLPYIIENSRSYWGSLGTILISISFAYAILRYRLLDIRFVIREGSIHFLTLVIVFSFYLYGLFALLDFVSVKNDISYETVTIVFVLLIAFTFEPIRKTINKVIHNIFVRREQNAREQITVMRTLLNSTTRFEELIERTLELFRIFFESKKVIFVFKDFKTGRIDTQLSTNGLIGISSNVISYLTENVEILVMDEIPYLLEEVTECDKENLNKVFSEMKKKRIGMLAPIGEPGELFGIIIFGEKENGSAYTADKIQYLQALLPQMTGSIANAMLYKNSIERLKK